MAKYKILFRREPCKFFPLGMILSDEWPKSILDEYGHDARILSTAVVAVDEGSEEERRFRNYVRENNIDIFEYRYALSGKKNFLDYPAYLLDLKSHARTTLEQGGLVDRFENQSPCDIHVDVEPGPGRTWGCGRGDKKQIRKFVLGRRHQVPKVDFFSIQTDVVMPGGRDFGVTRRCRDILLSEGITGMQFLPFAKDEKKIPDECLLLSESSDSRNDLVDLFQMTIIERVEPIRVNAIYDASTCRYCAVQVGGIDPPIHAYEWKRSMLKPVDLQILDRVALPDGEIVLLPLCYTIASPKFINVIEKYKLTGFTKHNVFTKWYYALPFTED